MSSEISKKLRSYETTQCEILARKIKHAARHFFENHGFTEYDTPILVPFPGEPYNPVFCVSYGQVKASLADSPQLYKMLLKLYGYPDYFQIAHCFRPIEHEENWHTRLTEFRQIDVEAQVNNLEHLLSLAEACITFIFRSLGYHVNIKKTEARQMAGFQYPSCQQPGTNGEPIEVILAYHMPLMEKLETGINFCPSHHVFAKPTNPDTVDASENWITMTTESFDILVNGVEIGGGDLRIMDEDLLRKMMRLFKVDENRYGLLFEAMRETDVEQIGGFAIGLERLVMVLSGCENIKEVSWFSEINEMGV